MAGIGAVLSRGRGGGRRRRPRGAAGFTAPAMRSTGWPSRNRIDGRQREDVVAAGAARARSSTLTRRHRQAAGVARGEAWIAGSIFVHGAHQGAQKSTSTGALARRAPGASQSASVTVDRQRRPCGSWPDGDLHADRDLLEELLDVRDVHPHAAVARGVADRGVGVGAVDADRRGGRADPARAERVARARPGCVLSSAAQGESGGYQAGSTCLSLISYSPVGVG